VDIDAGAVGGDAARVTLAELLVTLAVLGLTLAGLFTGLDHGQHAYAIGMARVESQQSARIALERLARELRGAGAGGEAFDAISVAEPERVVLHVDLDGDGAARGRGETIAWRLAETVLRRDAGGGAQPVVEGVRSLRLEYLDVAGRPARAPGEVRSVVITLTTEGGRPGAGGATTFTTRVGLRNRPSGPSGATGTIKSDPEK
jgi:type II secretory pathway component PulJ